MSTCGILSLFYALILFSATSPEEIETTESSVPEVIACTDSGAKIDPAVLAALNARYSQPTDYNLLNRWPGAMGDPLILTWSFVPDGTPIPSTMPNEPAGESETFFRMDQHFAGARAIWIQQFELAMARWGEVAGVRLVRVRSGTQEWDDGAVWGASGSSNRGEIRIAMHFIDGASGTLAYATAPGTAGAGDIVFDRAETWADTTGSYRKLRNVIMHEVGHALGLAHTCPNNGTKLMEPLYAGLLDGPQLDDIRGMQRLYGDAYEPNDSMPQATDLGSLPQNGRVVVGAGATSPAFSSSPGLDATSDSDWYRWTVTRPVHVSIYLTPFGGSYEDAPQVGGNCPSGPLTNASFIADINFELFDGSGSLLRTVAAAPLGGTELITDFTLPSSGTYFVRVSSASVFQTQLYSLTVIDVTPPGSFALLTPANGASDVVNTPVFDWTDSDGGNIQYSIAVRNGTSVVASASNLTTSSWQAPNPLTVGGTYQWSVTASNSAGVTNASNNNATFTTINVAPPAAPTLRFPDNFATNVPRSVLLRWYPSFGATSYVVTLRDATTTAVVRTTPVVTESLFVDPPLDANRSIIWNVTAIGPGGSRTSAPFQYSTGGSVITFSTTSPIAGAIDVSITPTLSWSSIPNDYQISGDFLQTSTGQRIPISPSTGQTTFVVNPWTPLEPNTEYCINVSARGPFGIEVPALNTGILVRTGPFGPPAFSLLTPSGATTRLPMFQWQDAYGTGIGYQITIRHGGVQVLQVQHPYTIFYLSDPVLRDVLCENEIYTWEVIAHNTVGTTPAANNGLAFSTTRILEPPGPFAVETSHIVDVPLDGPIRWGDAPGCLETYSVRICDNSTLLQSADNIGTLSYQVPQPLKVGHTYFADVIATNTAGNRYGNTTPSTGNQHKSFTTIAPPFKSGMWRTVGLLPCCDGPQGQATRVHALAPWLGRMYLGGYFPGGTSDFRVAEWNGSAWQGLHFPDNNWQNREILALSATDSGLIAGGAVSSGQLASGGPLMRWNGAAWSSDPQRFGDANVHDTVVCSFASNGTDLIAAGDLWMPPRAGLPRSRIGSARYSQGTWSPIVMGNYGFIVPVVKLLGGQFRAAFVSTSTGSNKFVGTFQYPTPTIPQNWQAEIEFPSPPSITPMAIGLELFRDHFVLARGDNNSVLQLTWDCARRGVDQRELGGLTATRPLAMAVYRDELYVGGDFTSIGGQPIAYIARWNGKEWATVGNGVNGPVDALIVFNDELWAGGAFLMNSPQGSSRVAIWSMPPSPGNFAQVTPHHLDRISGPLTLRWSQADGQDVRYAVSIYPISQANPIASVQDLIATSWTPSQTLPNGRYEWRVTASDSRGNLRAANAGTEFSIGARCPADLDDGSGAGVPDGGVTIEDLLYFLGEYLLGSIHADLDDGSGAGTPDGGVTIEDLLYFLLRFDAGC